MSIANEITELAILHPTDAAKLTHAAEMMRDLINFWDDRARLAPALWFMHIFGNMENLVFDVYDGAGIIAFAQVRPNWRASCYAAVWDRPPGLHVIRLLKQASAVAFLKYNLHSIDSFTSEDNRGALIAARGTGAERRGFITDGVAYLGMKKNGVWHELRRETLGLPPVARGPGGPV